MWLSVNKGCIFIIFGNNFEKSSYERRLKDGFKGSIYKLYYYMVL